ncbi:hypothetical protein FN846DRAFT_976710 [Sphaerosporella brunnea]|uniref:Uncharacterized protein n=1 Tax=Sphaerosporella brunnea TaxID=1250544 RepID=A0A5J5EFT3_9PEZI|nr:hypothetical protein FN846DRAFT_976710 [Sphaerosporella brunnea]
MLTRIYSAFLVALCFLGFAAANVEKEIFLGPAPSSWSLNGVGDHLPQLAPSEHCSNCRAIRSRLSTSFAGKGAEHWVKIDGLKEAKRYEVRICWAATQPTDFTLDLYTPEQVLAESLLDSIREYSSNSPTARIEGEGQVLYLRVLAKTAYVSSSRARMENPEPVDVDIILDPYLLNVLPESLLKIVGLLVVVAVFSWWLGGWVHRALLGVASSGKSAKAGVKKDI